MKNKALEDSVLASLADDNQVKELNNTAIQKESNREDSSEVNHYHCDNDYHCEHCK